MTRSLQVEPPGPSRPTFSWRLGAPALAHAPWWWRALSALAWSFLVALSAFAAVLVGFATSRIWNELDVPLRAGARRALTSWVYLCCVAGAAETLTHHLYRRPDLSFLLTCPLRDRALFTLKLRQTLRSALVVTGFAVLLLIGFGIESAAPPRTWPWMLGFAVLFVLSVQAPAVLLAVLERMRVGFSAVVLGLSLLIAAALAACFYFEAWDRAGEALERASRGRWAEWLPGAWLSEGLVLVGAGDLEGASLRFAASLALVAACAAGVLALLPRRYRHAQIVARLAAAPDAVEETSWHRWRRRRADASADASRTKADGPLAAWLRKRWPDRFQALLQLITRNPTPQRLEPHLVVSALWFLAALSFGKAWELAGRAANEPDPAALHVGYFLAFLTAYVACMRPSWTRSSAFASLTPKPKLTVRDAVALGRAGIAATDRGRHDHPLIETLPISLPRFTAALALATATETLAVLAVSAPFVLALPFALVWKLAGLLGACGLILWSSLTLAITHANSYRQHRRRSRLRSLLVGCVVATGVFAGTGVVSVVVALLWSRWPPSDSAVGGFFLALLALFGVVILVSPALSYLGILRREKRHAFDAEYRSAPFGGSHLQRW